MSNLASNAAWLFIRALIRGHLELPKKHYGTEKTDYIEANHTLLNTFTSMFAPAFVSANLWYGDKLRYWQLEEEVDQWTEKHKDYTL